MYSQQNLYDAGNIESEKQILGVMLWLESNNPLQAAEARTHTQNLQRLFFGYLSHQFIVDQKGGS